MGRACTTTSMEMSLRLRGGQFLVSLGGQITVSPDTRSCRWRGWVIPDSVGYWSNLSSKGSNCDWTPAARMPDEASHSPRRILYPLPSTLAQVRRLGCEIRGAGPVGS